MDKVLHYPQGTQTVFLQIDLKVLPLQTTGAVFPVGSAHEAGMYTLLRV